MGGGDQKSPDLILKCLAHFDVRRSKESNCCYFGLTRRGAAKSGRRLLPVNQVMSETGGFVPPDSTVVCVCVIAIDHQKKATIVIAIGSANDCESMIFFMDQKSQCPVTRYAL